MKNIKIFLSIFFVASFVFKLTAQKPQTPTPSEIYFKMQQLNVLASALYIAAHPDDENTRLITYLTHHHKAHTNYLSLTRGNGGQNLISNELGIDLGIIRTNELWNARKVDGGNQFFSSADDFGYSKHPKEAFEKWNKNALLQQMVYLIRKEQPDVIVNRFDHRTEGNTHGHHTASAQLSKQAFNLANDKNFKISENSNLKKWQPQRLFFNVSWFFFGSKQAFEKADKSKYIPLNIGIYYNDLGKNNQEIASLSRSQHQSQGFGDLSSRGEEIDYVELVDGKNLNTDNLFEGIDTSWNRIEGGNKIEPLVTKLINEFDFKTPSKSINLLTTIYNQIEALPESTWKTRKLKEVKNLIKDCAGLFLDITTNDAYTIPNKPIDVKIEVANRCNVDLTVKNITVNNNTKTYDRLVKNNDVIYEYITTSFSNNDLTNFSFINNFTDFKKQFDHVSNNKIGLEINNVYLEYDLPIQYRYKDVVKGEIYKPFHIIPAISIQFNKEIILNNKTNTEIAVLISNYANEDFSGVLEIFQTNNSNRQKLVYKQTASISPLEKNKEIKLNTTLENGTYIVKFHSNNEYFENQIKWIDYAHIPKNYHLKPAKTQIVYFDNKLLKKHKLGYIMGAGDEIPQILSNIGYQVDLIDLKTIKRDDLSKYESIILGIRAFNTEDELILKNEWLFDYVKNGGNLITQYVTNINLKTEKIAPYDLKIGKTRVTNENAIVNFINPHHKVLTEPFKINQQNFQNWIQEQGLYYADNFDENFQPIISSNDEGEKPSEGALVITKHGKGYYIYTGLSFFRQLPAGNIGALELFINLIELKDE